MDKTAQERGLLNRLREHANVSGRLLESVNPKFQQMMTEVRSTDERVREYARQCRELIKTAKLLLTRRDYLAASTNMAMFHERVRYIAAELAKLVGSIDKEGYKILLDQFDTDQKNRIFRYDPKAEINLDKPLFTDDMEVFASLKSLAGIADWWANLTNDRAKAMKTLEKSLSVGFLKTMRENSINMFNESQRFLAQLLGTLKKLAGAVATRKPAMYVKMATDFIKRFEAYHESFANYYANTVGPLKQEHEKMLEESRAAEQKQYEQAQGFFEGGGAPKSPEEMKSQVSLAPAPAKPAAVPTQKEKEEALKKIDKEQAEKQIPFDLIKQKQKAAEFIAAIDKIAASGTQNDLVRAILAFSEELETSDPQTSVKLLAIAEGIQEDDKEEDKLVLEAVQYAKAKMWRNLGNVMARMDKAEGQLKINGAESIRLLKYFHNPVLKSTVVPLFDWIAYTEGYNDGWGASPKERENDIKFTQAVLDNIAKKTQK